MSKETMESIDLKEFDLADVLTNPEKQAELFDEEEV